MVRFRTTLGDIDVNLLPNIAPQTVANFLRYVNKGAYDNSFVHRSVPGFIWQGGGYKWQNNAPVEIPSDPPVRNEFNASNIRGTIAMAKLGNDPNSATNQWFFNLADNSRNLNGQNGGFTVFGRIANTAGLAIMDRIAAVPVSSSFGSPFDAIPLVDYRGGNVAEANLVRILGIVQIQSATAPAISSITLPSDYGGMTAAAPGSFVEIRGVNLSGDVARNWNLGDFIGGNAPTFMDGVAVTVNGEPAFVGYISPTLLKIQVPGNVPIGTPVPVVVNYRNQVSDPSTITLKALSPGLFAPPAFKVNDRQYVVAVNPVTLSLAPVVPVAAGETYVFYGVGFGPLNSTVPVAGRIAVEPAPLAAPVQFKIGGIDAPVGFAGLATGIIGLYQFSVTIPRGVESGDQPVEVTVGGELIPQSLYLPVR